MNRKDFYKFYRTLRVESDEKVKEIANFVFTAFDRDSNGKIDFTEFLCMFNLERFSLEKIIYLGGYAITSLGTMRQKLDYVFALYDKDKNNSIDRNEMIRVISAMYDLLGKSKTDYPPERCVEDVFSLIDVNNDRTLTKDEFIDGVLKNPYLSDIISPFNE
jgi:Ca2+-binding EF-hand superfamily protein